MGVERFEYRRLARALLAAVRRRGVGAGGLTAAAVLLRGGLACADPPSDVFLDAQDPGSRVGLMAVIGPGLRASYDRRVEIEQQISELRVQAYADLMYPYGEGSLHADLRLFLLTFGVSAGYHDEWRLLAFEPDYTRSAGSQPGAGYAFGRDVGGRVARTEATGAVADAQGQFFGPVGDTQLSRSLRREKEQYADIRRESWGFVEGRAGFVWPARSFLLVSTTALRYEARPDVSYDWQLATVLDGGVHVRSETYAFFRDPSIGFVGPALRVLNLPRRELTGDLVNDVPTAGGGTAVVRTARAGDACQSAAGIPCGQRRTWELHYGFVAGLRPGWVSFDDVLLARLYTTAGLGNPLFGTHVLGAPVSLVFAYEVTLWP